MEAIAIIGCIAAVVSAYRDGGAIVDRIKQKRLARQAPPPTRLLEESLARGPTAVEEAKENGIERFGPRYAEGDKIALDSLKDILIDLQGSLIRHLRRAQDDDHMADFGTLVDASDFGRIRTVTVLNELYMRVATEATIPQTPFGGDMRAFGNPQMATQADRITPGILSEAPPTTSFGSMTQASHHLLATPEHPQTQSTAPSPQRIEPRSAPKGGFLDRFRRKSSTEESSSRKSSTRTFSIRSKDETALDNRQTKTLSPSPFTSPQASIDEDNPWATESTSPAPAENETPADTSMSRASTLVPGNMQQPSTVRSTLPSSNVRMLSPYERHGGFCKGAYKLQVHEKDAMKLRNQSTAKTGEGYYWACCSSKCAFEGPARQDGKTWAFDDTVRESHGIRYRWSFLAKAHVSLSKVKNGKYDYGCVFCIYDGFECAVFQGIKAFVEHIGTHRSSSIAETMLQRIKCINDRVATADEDFDVNLTPLEASPKPATVADTSQLRQPSILSTAASDRVSWSTNGDNTMADVDPWRDAT
ncbi:MAG: hypothetical protein L6R40_003644 [Gallowayella cf. fulva]|nr:MAG: hypothetical protein L6R40_003644 [Xanthomendoza cf. fulva]